VAGTHQINTDVLDRAHEGTEVLIGNARHESEGELTGRQQTGQADRVATVGLDPIT